MARPSKLSPEQWEEIIRRAAGGESTAALAREFSISRSAISDRVSVVSDRVRETARKVAEAQTALAALPVAQQYAVLNLAEKLRNISSSLASAAELGAQTAHRMHALANSAAQAVDDAGPTIEQVGTVMALAKAGNEAARPGLELLAANKDKMQADEAAGAVALQVEFVRRDDGTVS